MGSVALPPVESRGKAPGRRLGSEAPEADSIFYDQSMIGASEFAYLTALRVYHLTICIFGFDSTHSCKRVVIIHLTNLADSINRAFHSFIHSFIRSSDSHTGRVPPGLRAHFRSTSSIVSSNQSFYSHVL